MFVVVKREINFKEIFSYELCCVFVFFVYLDGIVCEIIKSLLMVILEKDIDFLVGLFVLSKKNNGFYWCNGID